MLGRPVSARVRPGSPLLQAAAFHRRQEGFRPAWWLGLPRQPWRRGPPVPPGQIEIDCFCTGRIFTELVTFRFSDFLVARPQAVSLRNRRGLTGGCRLGRGGAFRGRRGLHMDLCGGYRSLRNRLMRAFEDDEHFFQAALKAAWRQIDQLIGAALACGRYRPNRKAFGKNAIVAGGVKPLSPLDLLLVLDVVHDASAVSLAAHCAAHTMFLRDDTRRECRIGDQQYLRGGGIRRQYLSDDAVGRDYGHAAHHA